MAQASSEKSSQRQTRSWFVVLALLIGLPFLMALSMRIWLGVPEERFSSAEGLAPLGLSGVETVEANALFYGRLFFCRFRVKKEGAAALYGQLETFETSEGVAEKPIALKLERAWWDPPAKVKGNYWKRGETTIWSPVGQPDLFYAVTRPDGPGGDGPEATKSPK